MKQKRRSTISHSRGKRIESIDLLRGIAIFLMVVDHIAYFWYDLPIDFVSIRFITRLALPVFAILMGYFLASNQSMNWRRFSQIVLAAVVVNLFFFTVTRHFEILANLSFCYLMFAIFRKWLKYFVPIVFLVGQDPSIQFFDYPTTVVLSLIAQGMILRDHGWKVAVAVAAVASLGHFIASLPISFPSYWNVSALLIAPAPINFSFYWFVPAMLIVAAAIQWPQLSVKPLNLAGRFPLSVYVAQYLIVFAGLFR